MNKIIRIINQNFKENGRKQNKNQVFKQEKSANTK